jgi:mannose-6-phosphate isomerase-like protein (cupin superfamily)
MKVRRVTTGHNAQGKAVVASDTEVDGISLSLLPGAEFHRLWGGDVAPRFPDNGAQPDWPSYFPPLGGFRFMMFTVAPHTTSRRAAADRHALLAEMAAKLPGLATHMEPNHPGMHTTDTIDFEYIIEGEVWLDLDDGATVRLRAGDTVVQNGTRHRWRNEGAEPCRIVVFMVGTHRTPSGIDVARSSA